MTAAALALAALAGTVAVLVGLLWLGQAAGRWLANTGHDDGTRLQPLAAVDWLTDAETAAAQRLAAVDAVQRQDLARLNAAVGLMHVRLNLVLERAMRDLGLDPDERRHERQWARLASGEYPTIGATA